MNVTTYDGVLRDSMAMEEGASHNVEVFRAGENRVGVDCNDASIRYYHHQLSFLQFGSTPLFLAVVSDITRHDSSVPAVQGVERGI
jgi:hypothetical protein